METSNTQVNPGSKLPWRARLAGRMLRLGWLPRPLARLFGRTGQAIAVGLLDKETLQAFIFDVYKNHVAAYDPREYQLEYEQQVLPYLQEYHNAGRLLNLFCGQGREAEFFARNGFTVTAVDNSPGMIEGAKIYSKEAGFETEFEVADCFTYSNPEKFDIIYLSPWMYDTFPDLADRIKLIQHYKNMMQPDGVMIISFARVLNPNTFGERTFYSLVRLSGVLSFNKWRAAKGDRFFHQIFHHYFLPGEIEAEMEEAGFEILLKKESADGRFNFCVIRPAQ